MSRQIIGLHSAARKYCIDRIAYWHRMYYELGKESCVLENGVYTNAASNIFPRYNVLYAILYELEKFLPEDFSNINEACALVILAGETAENNYTKPTFGEIEINAMANERRNFVDYIESLGADDLLKIEPLFHRRVISKIQSKKIWDSLKEEWDIAKGCYWFPLKETDRDDVFAFQDKYFCSEVDIDHLKAILEKRNIDKIFELREDGTEYEIDLYPFNPYYNGDEGFWCSKEFDWVIYASHESSITIAGDWLICEIKRIWPNWVERVYIDPFFE